MNGPALTHVPFSEQARAQGKKPTALAKTTAAWRADDTKGKKRCIWHTEHHMMTDGSTAFSNRESRLKCDFRLLLISSLQYNNLFSVKEMNCFFVGPSILNHFASQKLPRLLRPDRVCVNGILIDTKHNKFMNVTATYSSPNLHAIRS